MGMALGAEAAEPLPLPRATRTPALSGMPRIARAAVAIPAVMAPEVGTADPSAMVPSAIAIVPWLGTEPLWRPGTVRR